jgi:hypothetical protein
MVSFAAYAGFLAHVAPRHKIARTTINNFVRTSRFMVQPMLTGRGQFWRLAPQELRDDLATAEHHCTVAVLLS